MLPQDRQHPDPNAVLLDGDHCSRVEVPPAKRGDPFDEVGKRRGAQPLDSHSDDGVRCCARYRKQRVKVGVERDDVLTSRRAYSRSSESVAAAIAMSPA
jgi:hypothetical protein